MWICVPAGVGMLAYGASRMIVKLAILQLACGYDAGICCGRERCVSVWGESEGQYTTYLVRFGKGNINLLIQIRGDGRRAVEDIV